MLIHFNKFKFSFQYQVILSQNFWNFLKSNTLFRQN